MFSESWKDFYGGRNIELERGWNKGKSSVDRLKEPAQQILKERIEFSEKLPLAEMPVGFRSTTSGVVPKNLK